MADESSPLAWSPWHLLTEEVECTDSGVYRVRMTDRSFPIPIGRFLGTDVDGILYIGEASSLARRHAEFLQGKRTAAGHPGGYRLYFLERFSRLQYDPWRKYEYQYSFAITREPGEVELKLIRQYMCQFGEVPPLNTAVPGGDYERYWMPAFESVRHELESL